MKSLALLRWRMSLALLLRRMSLALLLQRMSGMLGLLGSSVYIFIFVEFILMHLACVKLYTLGLAPMCSCRHPMSLVARDMIRGRH